MKLARLVIILMISGLIFIQSCSKETHTIKIAQRNSTDLQDAITFLSSESVSDIFSDLSVSENEIDTLEFLSIYAADDKMIGFLKNQSAGIIEPVKFLAVKSQWVLHDAAVTDSDFEKQFSRIDIQKQEVHIEFSQENNQLSLTENIVFKGEIPLNIIYLNQYGNIDVESIMFNGHEVEYYQEYFFSQNLYDQKRKINYRKIWVVLPPDHHNENNVLIVKRKGEIYYEPFRGIVTGWSQSDGLRIGFPIFSKTEFDSEIEFEYFFDLPPDWEVALEGPSKKNDEKRDGKNYTFNVKRTHDSNALCTCCYYGFAAAPYSIDQFTVNNTIIELYLFPSSKKYSNRLKSEINNIITYFEKIYGSFPEKKLLFAEVPSIGSAQYNQNAIFIPQNIIKGQNDVHLIQTLSHEISHAWWFNKVNFKDPWMIEGLADFSSILYLVNTHDFNYEDSVREVCEHYIVEDQDPFRSNSEFVIGDNLFYKRTACFLGMMRSLMGKSRFSSLLKKMADQDQELNIFDHHQVSSMIEKSSNKTIAELFESWRKKPSLLEARFDVSSQKSEQDNKWIVRTSVSRSGALQEFPLDVIIKTKNSQVRKTIPPIRQNDIYLFHLSEKPVQIFLDKRYEIFGDYSAAKELREIRKQIIQKEDADSKKRQDVSQEISALKSIINRNASPYILVECNFLLARCYFLLSEYLKAEEYVNKANMIRGKSILAQSQESLITQSDYILGSIYYDQQNWDAAVKHYMQGLDMVSHSLEYAEFSQLLQLVILVNKGNIKKARSKLLDYRKIVERNSKTLIDQSENPGLATLELLSDLLFSDRYSGEQSKIIIQPGKQTSVLFYRKAY